jgi:hypothetical protein
MFVSILAPFVVMSPSTVILPLRRKRNERKSPVHQ